MRILCKRLLLCVCLLSWSAGLVASKKPTAGIELAGEGKWFSMAKESALELAKKYSNTFDFVNPRTSDVDVLFVFTGDEHPLQRIYYRGKLNQVFETIQSAGPKDSFWFHYHSGQKGTLSTVYNLLRDSYLVENLDLNLMSLGLPSDLDRQIKGFLERSPEEERGILKKRLEGLNEEIEKRKKRIESEKEEESWLLKGVDELKARVEQLNKKIEAKKERANSLLESINKLESRLENFNKMKDKLSRRLEGK